MRKIPFLIALLLFGGLACSLTQGQISGSLPILKTPTRAIYQTGPPSPTLTATQEAGCKVTAQALRLRSGPNAETSTLAYLHAGNRLRILPTPSAGVWLAVETSTGKAGFVNSTFTDCKKRNP